MGQTCDTMQGLTDVWRRNLQHISLFHFEMPLRLDGSSARAYLLAELRSLHARLEAHVGRPISRDSLHESVTLYNRTRALVRRLYAHAADFTPSDLYDLVKAAFQMPKEAYNQDAAGKRQDPGPLSAALLVLRSPARRGRPRPW